MSWSSIAIRTADRSLFDAWARLNAALSAALSSSPGSGIPITNGEETAIPLGSVLMVGEVPGAMMLAMSAYEMTVAGVAVGTMATQGAAGTMATSGVVPVRFDPNLIESPLEIGMPVYAYEFGLATIFAGHALPFGTIWDASTFDEEHGHVVQVLLAPTANVIHEGS